MRLKKIKLAGFKSFVDPTTIPFPGDMTAIVGPNGCGKSNVIDAVRWVLGESSAKNLRGDAMTDVIFNGSSARKPVGQCSVELVFDNSSGRIGGEFAQYNELAVKRLVTRDAQSLYFLNGTRCRRRDVTDLFLGTGLGPRSYAIIEQGMISRLIESKPQELRVFIEEAAGISKYKERRRETENRIRHTQDNLERLEDVRGELGRQLEKLQRQAAAAQRYKALKASERKLKGELSAIRWLKHTQHIEKIEGELAKEQNELDALIAQQRGDEAGIEKYRTQSEDIKTALDDVQQAVFTISTQITRIEQNTLHSQQRDNQISAELEDLHQRRELLAASLQEAEQALEKADMSLEQSEPELLMLEETIFQAEERAESAESALRDYNRKRREQEQHYHSLKQKVQGLHSQIQSVTSMQLRTTQRIGELNDELTALDDDTLSERLEEAQAEQELAAEKSAIAEDEVIISKDALNAASELYQTATAAQAGCQRELDQAASRFAALEALQELAEAEAGELPEGVALLWKSINVKPGFEALIEKVTVWLNNPLVAAEFPVETLIASAEHFPQGHRILPLHTDRPPAEGTLASCLNDGYIPSLFYRIRLVADLAAARTLLPALAAGESVVTETGEWLSADWLLRGTVQEDSAGALQRHAQMAQLQSEIDSLSEQLAELQFQADSAAEEKTRAEEHLEITRQAQVRSAQQQQQAAHQVAMLKQEVAQLALRQQKIRDELTRQKQTLAGDDEQLDTLTAQLEVLEMQLMDAEEEEQNASSERERFEHEQQDARQSAEQQKSRKHQLELSVQQQRNQQQLYREQVTRNQAQLAEYRQREDALTQEKQSLSQPMAMHEAQLAQLLDDREVQEALRIEKQNALSDVEALLREAQQGHHGVAVKIQQRNTVIDGLKIDIEGARVRAMSVLELLQETGQSLKEILPDLDDTADEKSWQQELEKTTAAVARLGAVNLAAVEEYETQAERKQHLDTQFDDLVSALDTLQSAIRKIDKETKTRFSATFEQVNEDLKQLFPKVFGGGSAYLALTDDDLLETGVTIMARPPGKKNSTIHLLSGGEKALTALSLVFAIFRLNPAPFCLLDEVDAPLDDANVGRFCKLVSEMSKSVQFIYITHNKIAMEMATHLTGVTMAEPGVSRMVAVDVDEAMAFVEA